MLDHLEGGKGSLWTIGNEPGGDHEGTKVNHPELYRTLRSKYPKLSDAEFSKNWPSIVEENAPLQARVLRQRMEESKLVGRMLKQKVKSEMKIESPDVQKLLLTGEIPKGWNVKQEVDRFGTAPGINSSTYLGKGIKLAQEIGATKMANTNISWLPSPNENVWPWGKMFERAGMDPGPFKTRGSWIKHSVEARGDLLREKILKEKPENVYFSGGNGKAVFDKLAKDGKPFQTTVNWVSPKGNAKSATFTVVQLGDSRIVHGPHFTAQMPKAVLDMRVRLMKGERPENAVGVQAGSPKPMVKSPGKVAKAAQKEAGSNLAKVPQKATPSEAEVKQKQAFRGMVNMWSGQGKSAAWIRDQLRGMKVPPAMINELV